MPDDDILILYEALSQILEIFQAFDDLNGIWNNQCGWGTYYEVLALTKPFHWS